MNLFRSEEHIERWLGGRAPGATIPVAKLSELAHAWWDDRVAPGVRPPSQRSMCSSDRKRFIVLQVKTMSSHQCAAGTRQWKRSSRLST